MGKKLIALRATICFTLLILPAFAQNVEITGQIGYQVNGGLNLRTSLFRKINVKNSMNYGATAGVLISDYFGVEFQWNRTQADTLAQPTGNGPNVNLFTLTQDQYIGNFVVHFSDRDTPLRPFAFFGMGASDLSPDRRNVGGVVRIVASFGGGAKYNFSRHFGLRGQMKYSPTYITTTSAGYWCDPFWGGCWAVGDSNYFNELDFTGGITFRF